MTRWLRVVGDTVFALGTLALGWFTLGLETGWSLREELLETESTTVESA
jgi:nitric oxide reductase subunit B